MESKLPLSIHHESKEMKRTDNLTGIVKSKVRTVSMYKIGSSRILDTPLHGEHLYMYAVRIDPIGTFTHDLCFLTATEIPVCGDLLPRQVES